MFVSLSSLAMGLPQSDLILGGIGPWQRSPTLHDSFGEVSRELHPRNMSPKGIEENMSSKANLKIPQKPSIDDSYTYINLYKYMSRYMNIRSTCD